MDQVSGQPTIRRIDKPVTEERNFGFEVVGSFPNDFDLAVNVVYRKRDQESYRVAIRQGRHVYVLSLQEDNEQEGCFEFFYHVRGYGYAITENTNLEDICLSLKKFIDVAKGGGAKINKMKLRFANTTHTVAEIDRLKERILAEDSVSGDALSRFPLRVIVEKYKQVTGDTEYKLELSSNGKEMRERKIPEAIKRYLPGFYRLTNEGHEFIYSVPE